MIPFLLKYWKPVLAMILAVAIWCHGHRTGTAWCEARHQAELAAAQKAQMRAAEEASRAEAARLEAEAERDRRNKELEDAAYAEPHSAACGLPASRVLRLRDR